MWVYPAAFGRLCVETFSYMPFNLTPFPAAFGRLCVETTTLLSGCLHCLPAAFGRLCVETYRLYAIIAGRNPAAFGRLCVETGKSGQGCAKSGQPPSGGCVLKHGNAATYTQDDIAAAFGRLYVETFP